VGYKDGIYILNPGYKAIQESELDLVVAGTQDAILMVESEARELTEEIMLGAVLFGHEMMKGVIKAIKELAAEAGKPAWGWTAPATDESLKERIRELATEPFTDAYQIKDKQQRYQRLDEVRQSILDKLTAEQEELDADVAVDMMSSLEKSIV